MQCRMDHIVLNIENDAKMLDFYINVLELEPERLEEYREERVPFPSVRLNADTVIDLFPKKLWQKNATTVPCRTTLNHVCLALDKSAWDDLTERLRVNRVDIEEGPVSRWGAHGTGTSIYFRDPEGTLIEARYYEPVAHSDNCLLGS